MTDDIEEKAPDTGDVEEETIEPDTGEDQDQDQPSDDTDEAETPELEKEGLIIHIDGEEEDQIDPDSDNTVIREMRRRHSEMKRKNRELREKLDAITQQQQQPHTDDELGQQPTIEACDYDTDLYNKKMEAWHEKKIAIKERQLQIEKQQQQQQQQWQERLNNYVERRQKLDVPDFTDAETAVEDILSTTQQGLIVDGADDPALVVYALGKNPKKLQELAAIKNPVKFAFAAAKLENKLKVSKRKPTAAPEKKITSSKSSRSTVDTTLERLRAKGDKTNDYSELIAYKRRLRRKSAQ